MQDRTDQGLDTGTRYAFHGFVLDPARETLAGPEGEVALRPKSFAVLSYLLAHAGRVCTKEELLDAVWSKTVVTEDSLTQCLVEIRRALGDQDRSVIRTVPRRGYLLAAEVRRAGSGMAAVGAGTVAEPVAEPVSGTVAGPVAGSVAGPAPATAATQGAGYIGAVPRASRLGFESVLAGAMLAGLFAFMTWRVVDDPEPAAELAAVETAATAPALSFLPEEISARGTTVAVLPFADMSPVGDHGYFGDGIAEEILNLLAKAPELRVIARTSSFSLRHQSLDIPAIGRRLGATHVLEGSVRPGGDRVRVTAQLVDARDGAHLWSETFERPLGEVLALQDEIAASVAGLLRATLAADAGRLDAIDPQAYEHKLRGAYLFSRRNAGDLEAAREQFQAALALEPDYGPAWVGLAGVLWVLMLADERVEPQEQKAFREAALRGVELSPRMPEAHLRAAASYGLIGSSAMRERHVEIARELDPGDPLLLGMLAGRAVREGDLERALDLQYAALRRDPLHFVNRYNLMSMLLAAGRVTDARREFDTLAELGVARPGWESKLLLLEGRHAEAWEILEQPSEGPDWISNGAMALHGLGREAEALARIETLRSEASHETSYEAALALAEFAAWRGDHDVALHWLGQVHQHLARLEPVPSVPTWAKLIALSPYLEPLRADPRFAELARIAE